MRRLLHGIAAAGVAGMAALALTAPAEAKTCSERLKVCQRFCVKSECGSPGMHVRHAAAISSRASRAAAGKASTSTRNAASPGSRRPRFRVHTKSPMCLSATGPRIPARCGQAPNDDHLRARECFRPYPCRRDRKERIGVAVESPKPGSAPCSSLRCAARGDHRRPLARDSRGIVRRAIGSPFGRLAKLRLGHAEARDRAACAGRECLPR